MTIAMPDSTRVEDLPDGYEAYLGYADGQYATAAELAARFPRAHRVILTVTGRTLGCDGIDCEPGNVNAADTRAWVQRKLAAAPRSRPVIYASVAGQPNYGMPWVIAALERNGVSLASVRLLSAHYGRGPHICGPRTCGVIDRPMDGTQWTDQYLTMGKAVDMSVLAPDFFSVQDRTETERIVQELGIVKQGSTGEAVKTVQGLLLARGYAIGVSGVLTAGVDGVFGPLTLAAVKKAQHDAGFSPAQQDGIVGPATWPVLLGVA